MKLFVEFPLSEDSDINYSTLHQTQMELPLQQAIWTVKSILRLLQ